MHEKSKCVSNKSHTGNKHAKATEQIQRNEFFENTLTKQAQNDQLEKYSENR